MRKYKKLHCFECFAWEKNKHSENEGLCRFEAPKSTTDLGYAIWPTTFADDWCFDAMTMKEFLENEAKEDT